MNNLKKIKQKDEGAMFLLLHLIKFDFFCVTNLQIIYADK